jgi:hypothetical protein
MKKFNIILILNLLIVLFSCSNDESNEDEVLKVPKILTNEVTDISIFSIKITGKLLDKGSSEVTELGFVVGYNSLPTVNNNLQKSISIADDNGNFYFTYQSIPSSTTLYFRSYAINSNGLAYGNEVKFITLPQKIFSGNLTLTTQQELDLFGSQSYTTIQGNFKIQGNINNLNSLSSLVIINGSFEVESTNILNFTGLDNLKVAYGFLARDNVSLMNFTGLNNFEKTTGDFLIINNDNIVNFEGLNKLKYVYYDFNVQGNDNLVNFSGLDNLILIGEDFIIDTNTKLISINSLINLNSIRYDINIFNNPLLQNLNGLERIIKIRRIEIINNSTLINLNGLNNLERIGWVLIINNNNNLTNLNGLEKLTSISDPEEGSSFIVIINNSSMINLNGLENLNIMGGTYRSLKITNNFNLLSFCALKKLFLNNPIFNIQDISNNLTNPNTNYVLSNCP